MTIRTLTAIALIPALVGCTFLDKDEPASDSDPIVTDDSGDTGVAPSTAMNPGTYNLVTEQIYSNTCGYDFVADAIRVTLTSTANTITIDNGQASYDFQVSGTTFSRTIDASWDAGDGLCFLRELGGESGDIVGPEFAEFTLDVTESPEGDCSNYDTTGYPCSYSLGYRLERVGD